MAEERKGKRKAISKKGSSKAIGNEGSCVDVVDADSSVSQWAVAIASLESRETRTRAEAAAAERWMQEFGLSDEVEALLRSGSLIQFREALMQVPQERRKEVKAVYSELFERTARMLSQIDEEDGDFDAPPAGSRRDVDRWPPKDQTRRGTGRFNV